jgi:hypothetical protein
MFSKFLSIILVSALSFLLIPTDFWHTCEEGHQTEIHDNKELSFEESHPSCDICDFNLFQLNIQESFLPKFKKNYSSLYVNQSVSSFQADLNTNFNKGPPQIIL